MREKAGTILSISALLSKFLAPFWSRELGTELFKGIMEQRFSSSFLSRNSLLCSSFHSFSRNPFFLKISSSISSIYFCPISFDMKTDLLHLSVLGCWDWIVLCTLGYWKHFSFSFDNLPLSFSFNCFLEKTFSLMLRWLAKCHQIICEFWVNIIKNKRVIRVRRTLIIHNSATTENLESSQN